MESLKKLLPAAPNWEIPWEAWQTELGGLFREMQQIPQNPKWHAEGDVWTHTQMVCEALVRMPAYRKSALEKQLALFLAALFHDIGKIKTTRLESGEWTSQGHARVGAEMARQLLWQQYALCGSPEKQHLREHVCNLVRYHSFPPHAIIEDDGKRKLLKIAANGEQIPSFALEGLFLLAEADARGRRSVDWSDFMERIQLGRELADEEGCLTSPYPFASAYSRFAYLEGKQIQPNQLLYDDTWGEVLLMSGLPGTGKDTWIQNHYSQLPMISLDEIRRELGISPEENQSRVLEAAREKAKEYLRKKQPFVWNATNLSPMVRKKQVDLFASYHASVRIVYLETSWEEQLRRNAGRKAQVPQQAVCRMLTKLTPPEAFEAHHVEWHCV